MSGGTATINGGAGGGGSRSTAATGTGSGSGGGAAPFRVRKATKSDEAGITSLIGKEQIALHKKFGQFSVPYLIETSVLAIVVWDEREKSVVGFATFLDAPPAGLPYKELGQGVWLQYVRSTFPTAPYSVRTLHRIASPPIMY